MPPRRTTPPAETPRRAATPGPAPAAPPAGRASSPRISADARARGAQAKSHRGVFNRYLRALQGAAVERLRQRLDEVEQALTRGTRLKRAPVFEEGRRVGTTERELALLPSERAQLLVRRAQIEASLAGAAPPDLRAAFLEMLPDYATRNGFTRDILLEVGVPPADLDACDIH